MNKYFAYIGLSFVPLFSLVSILSAQSYLDRNHIVEPQIDKLIKARYGNEYICNGFSMMDSLVLYSTKEKNYRHQDPYGTLRGCIFYSACRYQEECDADTFITGVVMGNQIIWDNLPGMKANPGGHLNYSQDINNDGKVELIFCEPSRESMHIGKGPWLFYLYVLSWDGKEVKFINSFDNEGNSMLLSDDGCELIKSNRKYIFNIQSSLPDNYFIPDMYKTKTYPIVTYTWKGSTIGLWSKK
jgi:hypothetical protein